MKILWLYFALLEEIMLKRTLIFVMSCALAAPLMSSCSDDSNKKDPQPKCPEQCDEGQHCDESTEFKCIPNEVNDTCPDECKNGCKDDGITCKDDEKVCPTDCKNGCKDDGVTCKDDETPVCPDECEAGCDDEGNCLEPECPDTCPEGQHCNESTNGKCIDDVKERFNCPLECPAGSYCDETTSSICMTKATDNVCPDCPDGSICDAANGICIVETTEISCPTCSEGSHCDELTKNVCLLDGDTPSQACPACPEGSICSEETEFRCVSETDQTPVCPVCPEGTSCNDDGLCTVIISTPSCPACPEGSHCDENTATRCILDSENPDDLTPTCPVCPEGSTCNEETGKCTVETTIPSCPTCATGSHCDETTSGLCLIDDDETGKLGCPVCANGTHCDETTDGRCQNDGYVEPKNKECDPGQITCNGNTLQECSLEYTYVDKTNCEDETKECFANAEGVAGCYESKCTPGTSICTPEGNVSVCNNFHEYEDGEKCSELEDGRTLCDAYETTASCVEPCVLGTQRCVDNQVETCGSDGHFAIADNGSCDSATQQCKVNEEQHTASCVNFDCSEGEAKCDGSVLYVCDAGWWKLSSDCTDSGLLCTQKEKTASCVEKKCDEGWKMCDGQYLNTCSGNAYQSEFCKKYGKDFQCIDQKDGKAECKQIVQIDTEAVDTDSDTIPDWLECSTNDNMLDPDDPIDYSQCPDTDRDGTPDYKDTDSDNDTIPDNIEANNEGGLYEPDDADYDGIPNYRDTDSDGNGILDKDEYQGGKDLDGDTIPDYLDYDNDGDGFSDKQEIEGLVIEGAVIDGNHFSGYCENRKQTTDKSLKGSAAQPLDCDGDTIPDYNDIDSDGDGISDKDEGLIRISVTSNGKKLGYYARYSTDTDKDGLTDAVEAFGLLNASKLSSVAKNTDGTYKITSFVDSDHDGVYDLLETDSDNDGLTDAIEATITCPNGLIPRLKDDTDGDGNKDSAEYAVAKAMGGKCKDGTSNCSITNMVCYSNYTIKNVYEFYFELPDNSKANDVLTFSPKVSKLDVVFNMDTTGSMSGEISNLKSSIGNSSSGIIPKVKAMVTESEFAITRFDDFKGSCGNYGSSGDVPYQLVTAMTSSISTLTSGVNTLNIHGGNDGPESDMQSLWQIIKGHNTAWTLTSWTGTGSLSRYSNSSDRWGGVNFRTGSLPVVTTITDADMHNGVSAKTVPTNDPDLDANDPDKGKKISDLICSGSTKTYCKTNSAYGSCISNPYYGADVVWAYKKKGARIITVVSGSGGLDQSYDLSEATNAIVPVCSFKNSSNAWICGENKCCTGYGTNVAQSPVNGKCVLRYQINSNGTGLGDTLVNGIDALVKYGTYEVTTRLRGNAIGNGQNTTCFIDKIEAKAYIKPTAEPEASCNPTATPYRYNGASYNNAFKDFATGTSNANKVGAKLQFTVYAKNNGCFKQDYDAHVFEAYIEVINPTTGLLFDTQKVSILVPALIDDNKGEAGN